MPITYYTIHEEVPDPMATALPSASINPPITIPITSTGSHNVASFNVPAGRDVTLRLTGGGASGEGAPTGSGSSGACGGGAGTLILLVPHALWAMGGTIVIGAGGAGAAHAPGNDGVDSTLTLNSVLQATAGKGHKTAGGGIGGVGGTNSHPGTVTVIADRPGGAGGDVGAFDPDNKGGDSGGGFGTGGLRGGPTQNGNAGSQAGGGGGGGGINAGGTTGGHGGDGGALIQFTL